MFLVSKLSTHYNLTPARGRDYNEIFQKHLKMVDQARKIVPGAYAVIGVHPAELTILTQYHSLERAKNIMMDGLEVAIQLIIEGKAVALKSGRPHYPVSKEVWDASMEVMHHAFTLARDANCPVQIHTERYTKEGMMEIRDMAKRTGIQPEKVIKHFAPPDIEGFKELGLFPSVISGKGIFDAIKAGPRFVMESDYMDDKNRPGAVLGPKTVPRRTKEMLARGVDEDLIHTVHVDNIESIYGINMDEDE